jgi:hypothetical protein
MMALLIVFCQYTSAQQIIPGKLVKILPGAKCYWAYSVRRVGTAHDSLHYYTIHVSLDQQVNDKPKGALHISNARIFCMFTNNGRKHKIRCVPIDNYWVADFSIRTNQPVPVVIETKYNKQRHSMRLQLNKGTYPGEDDTMMFGLDKNKRSRTPAPAP